MLPRIVIQEIAKIEAAKDIPSNWAVDETLLPAFQTPEFKVYPEAHTAQIEDTKFDH